MTDLIDNVLSRYLIIILICSVLPSCTWLSDREYTQQYWPFQGIRRIAVFLQRWPVYLQKSGQENLGEEFISTKTVFLGPWEQAVKVPPRAVDIQDIDDCLMGEILVGMLERKGYQVDLAEVPFGGASLTVEMLMAQYQAINPPVDAFLFCYYSPALYIFQAGATPREHGQRTYSLREIVRLLRPADDAVIWVGARSSTKAPPNSISHAFVYLSFTFFRATDWQTLMTAADSQAGGKVRPWIPRCPPSHTEEDYWANPGIIQDLMVSNLRCRLQHQIPYAF